MFAINTFFRDGVFGRKRKKITQTNFAHKRPKTDDDSVGLAAGAPLLPTARAAPTDDDSRPAFSPANDHSSPVDDGVPVTVVATPDLDRNGPAVGESETSSVQPSTQSKTKSNNDDYRCAKRNIYHDLEKIPNAHINEDLMNFFGQIDKNGKKQGLKKIFKMCYKTLNNVEEAKKMTNQLAIKPYVVMGLKTFNDIGSLKSSLGKDVRGKVEKCHKRKILNKTICLKFIELFGEEYYELDNKALKEVYVPRAHKKLKIREETDVGNERLSCVISIDSLNPSFNSSDWQNDQDGVDFNITASKIDDLAKSMAEYYSKIKQNNISLLNKSNLKNEISKIINKKHSFYSSDVVENLVLYFSNDDFLSKSDELWKSSASNLIGELIVKLIGMFSNMKYNMAYLTSCLVCVFKDVVKISSIPSEELPSQFSVFLNTIKKHVKHNDAKIWKTWFVSTMFFDWCLVVANIFMPDKKITSFDEAIILNAKKYLSKIKHEYYIFGSRGKSSKIGIFEFSKKEDVLDIAVVEEPLAVVEEPLAVVEEPPAVVEEPALVKESSESVKKLKPTEVLEADGELHKPVKKQNCMRKTKVINEVEQVKEIKSKRSFKKNKKKMKNIFIPEENKSIIESMLTNNETNYENKGKKFICVRSEFSFSNSFQNLNNLIIYPQSVVTTRPTNNISNYYGSVTSYQPNTQCLQPNNTTLLHRPPLSSSTVIPNSMPPNTTVCHPLPYKTAANNGTHHSGMLCECNFSNSFQNSNNLTIYPQSVVTTRPTNNSSNYYGSVTSYQPNTQCLQPNNTTLLHRPPLSSSTVIPNSMPPNTTVCHLLRYKTAANNGTHHSGMLRELLPPPYPNTSNVGTRPRNNKNVRAPQRPNDKTLRAVSTNVVLANPRSCLKPCCSTQKSVIYKPSVTKSSTENAYQAPVTYPLSPDLPNSLSPNMPHHPSSNSKSTMKCSNENCSFIVYTEHFDPYMILCCLNACYCSVGCQLADWERHRVTCFSTQNFSIS